MSPRLSLYPVIAVFLCAPAFAAAQTPAPVIEPNGIARPPNVDGFYQALRNFHMTFHLPKGLQIVATGKQISQEKDSNGGQKVVWTSGEPIAVAGFNLGDFVAQNTKTPQGFEVQAYANAEVPDEVKGLVRFLDAHPGAHAALGTMSTMPKWVDLRQNGKLDWFFNEYVYGTELPHYDISSEFTNADGETSVHLKLTQANVSKDFLMLVPIYLQLADGRTLRIVNIALQGDTTFDRTLKLGKLPAAPRKMLLNYNADILSD